MNARQILTQAIDAYNIDHFDDEQKHLHVTLGEFTSQLGTMIGISIPHSKGRLTFNENYTDASDEDNAYDRLLIRFIYNSLQKLTK